ncbi:hypothetical protein TrST_g10644 [Triparma strigata]|uniref:Uncharacterized protein n=1 Tax=Triparma strigata TaxID=1606541 RepID=A0A9W7EH41_9STRA|nr:hypothetical protein TrST_g10644 [Triparma strigata]
MPADDALESLSLQLLLAGSFGVSPFVSYLLVAYSLGSQLFEDAPLQLINFFSNSYIKWFCYIFGVVAFLVDCTFPNYIHFYYYVTRNPNENLKKAYEMVGPLKVWMGVLGGVAAVGICFGEELQGIWSVGEEEEEEEEEEDESTERRLEEEELPRSILVVYNLLVMCMGVGVTMLTFAFSTSVKKSIESSWRRLFWVLGETAFCVLVLVPSLWMEGVAMLGGLLFGGVAVLGVVRVMNSEERKRIEKDCNVFDPPSASSIIHARQKVGNIVIEESGSGEYVEMGSVGGSPAKGLGVGVV